MSFLQKLNPEFILRLGLGLTYLYSGQNLIQHPAAWTWAIPYWLREIMGQAIDVLLYIKIQGAVEILFALVLLAWFIRGRWVRYVAFLSSLEFTMILILAFLPFSETNFIVTFRDMGLFGAALALLIITLPHALPVEDKIIYKSN